MNIVMSIKPEWANKIYSGEKTIEFRKTEPKFHDYSFPFMAKNNDVAFIYETKPVGFVTGLCRITIAGYIDFSRPLSDFQYELIKCGCCSEEFLRNYSNGKKLVALRIHSLERMAPTEIKYFTPKERPPQSWCYTNAYICYGTFNYDHRIKGPDD